MKGKLDEGITKEKAKSDLEGIIAVVGTDGVGSVIDRAAQFVMQMIDVLEKRLGNPDMIDSLYVSGPAAAIALRVLPETIQGIAQDYVDGTYDERTTRVRLHEVKLSYLDVLEERGMTLQKVTELKGMYFRGYSVE